MNGSVFRGKTLNVELALGKYKIPQVTEADGRDRSSVTVITAFLVTRTINIDSSLGASGQSCDNLALFAHNSAKT